MSAVAQSISGMTVGEKNRTGLIGYTGFVGSNLARQVEFDELFNSTNIADIDNKKFSLLVCAGARAEKWRINQDPETDKAEIANLMQHLGKTQADKVVLISTIDVYKSPNNVDEGSQIETKDLHPYGLHRYELEKFCQKNFNCLVVRLPGLFGEGLKKNIIFDFINDNNLDRIHHAGAFQYYNLDNLWRDITIALKADLKVLNVATEPIRTDELARDCFGMDNFVCEPEGAVPGSYDFHTKHANLFGKNGSYIYDKADIMSDIKKFVAKQTSRER